MASVALIANWNAELPKVSNPDATLQPQPLMEERAKKPVEELQLKSRYFFNNLNGYFKSSGRMLRVTAWIQSFVFVAQFLRL
jgi:hypothetical protein